MVDLLLTILLAGIAVSFSVEFIALLISWVVDKDYVYNVVTLPLAFGAMFVLSDLNKTFFVSVPAIAFVALVLKRFLNKPNVMSTRLNRL